MNKERLTLLIALSILIVVTIIVFLTGAKTKQPEEVKVEVQHQVEVQKPITAIKPDLITTGTPKAKEEPKVEEVIVVTPPAAAGPVAQQVWDAMKAKGWSDAVCAGIMGNMMAECGGSTLDLNPYCHGDSGTSYGLCQWHNGRKMNMLTFNGANYNTTNNLPPIEHQIDYLEYELQGYDILNSTKSCEQIAYDFCVKFERPANKYTKAENRKQLAKIAYQEFAQK